ncbi:MAG: 50S ribosomal protein L6 [Hyphomicrobium sp.]|nr:50S ribosomal protein L6 [Hyphomicrobium sp.]PPC82658.1 MAG: 50S ribosomal protein L6 [Hyphomicrobium sp.]
MSRIGKKPVTVPSNVTATVSGQTVKVKGPKGELSFTAPEELKVEKTTEGIAVTPIEDTKRSRAMWGMSRTRVQNLVKGVTDGYSHTLEIHGVGFRAALKGKDQLQMQVGYSHEVLHKIPTGVEVKVAGAKQEIVVVSGIDKQLVGQVAAEIRAYRKPEPYQGKGVRYQGEFIFRKEGKKK